MENMPVFSETQRPTQWWIWLIVLAINALAWWGIVQQLIMGIDFGNNPMSDAGLILFAIFTLLIALFFFNTRLETKLSDKGVSVRLWPLHTKAKSFSWDELVHAEVKKYRPMSDYGGWGLRLGRQGVAYNMSGNWGLQLDFKNGKHILIGTNRPEALNTALGQIFNQTAKKSTD